MDKLECRHDNTMISPSLGLSDMVGRMALAGVVEVGQAIGEVARNLIGVVLFAGLALAKKIKLVA